MGVTELVLKWIVAHYDGLEDEDRLDFVEQFLDDGGSVGGEYTDEAEQWVTERLTMCVLEHKELLDAVLESIDWERIQHWAFTTLANCG